jgi:hypothetical protein
MGVMQGYAQPCRAHHRRVVIAVVVAASAFRVSAHARTRRVAAAE